MTGESRPRILVVDDDPAVLECLRDALEAAGYAAEALTSPRAALARVAEEAFDLVVTDVEMAELRGTELMRAIHAARPDQLVLLITAFGSIDLAVDSVRAGACDFVTKPFSDERFVLAVERALEERRMRREIVRLRRALAGTSGVVARSPAMRRALELAQRAARSTATVLLTGESGTGKSLLARTIHEESERRGRPFVAINCAALPATLAESELFGVRRGAFTDAREDRPGLFAQAQGGTVLLDEVGELTPEVQPKLLHVLETGRVRPVGGAGETDVDVRVVAATNRPLEAALEDGRFREDLYYRLNVIRIEVPPLRERREDLEPLVDLLLERASLRHGRAPVGVSGAAWRWLAAHPWPGNVRELANVLERAVAMTEHDTIVPDDLQLAAGPVRGDFLDAAVVRRLPLAAVEQEYIARVLRATDGNKADAADILGMDRRTLYRRLGDDG